MNHIRALLTKRFYRELRGERIPRKKFNKAIKEIIGGLSDSLGHKLHKKRLGGHGTGKRGGYRTICYYKIKEFLIFFFMYLKSKKSKIEPKEMKELILLSREYDNLNEEKIENLIKIMDFINYDYNTD